MSKKQLQLALAQNSELEMVRKALSHHDHKAAQVRCKLFCALALAQLGHVHYAARIVRCICLFSSALTDNRLADGNTNVAQKR